MKNGRLRRFWPYLRPFSKSLILLFASILLGILITLPTPWCEKVIIDSALPQKNWHLLLSMTGLIVAFFIGQRILIFIRGYLSARVRQKVLTDVRMDLYGHLQSMSLRFFGRHPIGNLLSRILSDVGYVQNLLNDELFEVLSSLVKIVVVVSFLIAISVKLTLLCLAVVPVLTLVFFLFKKKVYQQNLELQETQARLSGQIEQNFAGMKLIQAEVIEERMREETLAASKELEQVGIRREMVGIFGNLLTTTLSYAPIIGILWGLGGYMVLHQALTLGELLAFTQYLLGLVNPTTRFFQFNMNLQAGYAALDRIYEILDEKPEISDRLEARPLSPPLQQIRFENVSLEFTDETPQKPRRIVALENVSFTVNAGEKVALVGPSGAGKSSVLNLLLRFYHPTRGKIIVNQQEIESYTLRSLRENLAYVSQEVFLFNTTVRHNLALGRELGEPKLYDTLALAEAKEFVTGLKGGIDAAIEERGSNFSGGQKQRLALARSFAREACCYLFDEATAALDAQTEQCVIQNLAAFLEHRTALIVAHRFSFLDLVDRILVFTDGRLVEDGTMHELLERRGVFYTLYQTQRGETEHERHEETRPTECGHCP